jgi:hypothetical protein
MSSVAGEPLEALGGGEPRARLFHLRTTGRTEIDWNHRPLT